MIDPESQGGLAVLGLGLFAGSSAISLACRGRTLARMSRIVGGALAVLGWVLFWLVPPTGGRLPAPALLLAAAAYPMIAVERGRGLALRVFVWLALGLNVAACALGTAALRGLSTIEAQETLLTLGLLGPPLAAALVAVVSRDRARSSGGARAPNAGP